jgi:hypothetical protein
VRTAILLAAAIGLSGCMPAFKCREVGGVEICETRQCRDRRGRFVKCPRDCEQIEAALRDRDLTDDAREAIGAHLDACRGHGEPVGFSVGPDGVFYCRDARGREWLSKGECD